MPISNKRAVKEVIMVMRKYILLILVLVSSLRAMEMGNDHFDGQIPFDVLAKIHTKDELIDTLKTYGIVPINVNVQWENILDAEGFGRLNQRTQKEIKDRMGYVEFLLGMEKPTPNPDSMVPARKDHDSQNIRSLFSFLSTHKYALVAGCALSGLAIDALITARTIPEKEWKEKPWRQRARLLISRMRTTTFFKNLFWQKE